MDVFDTHLWSLTATYNKTTWVWSNCSKGDVPFFLELLSLFNIM